MQENSASKKADILIVTEPDKHIKKYGLYLMNKLYELTNRKCMILSEKLYQGQEFKIDPNQGMVFIGKTETSEMLMDSIDWKYSELNMRYGWIGRRAVIYVIKQKLNHEDYKKLKLLFDAQKDQIKNGKIFDEMKHFDERITNIKDMSKTLVIAAPLYAIGAPFYAFSYLWYKRHTGYNELWRQQYSYLVNRFIFEEIDNFLKVE